MMLRTACAWLPMALWLLEPATASTDDSQAAAKCDQALADAGTLNSFGLFAGAGACQAAARPPDVAFLLIIGQVRSVSDMGLLQPSSNDDKKKVADLYGYIFYYAGGAGDDALYRDPQKSDSLFARIAAWRPELPENYDPGWAYRRRPDEPRYFQSMEFDRRARIIQLQHYAALLRDDTYYAAHTEEVELRRRNPNGYVEGTPDYLRMEQLHQIMNDAAARIPAPAYPKPPPFEFTPDPEADFRQIHTGFNGPAGTETVVATTADAARKTWLAKTMGKHELEALLHQVDFEHENLVLHAIGRRLNSTGRIHVLDAESGNDDESVFVSVAIGVNEDECDWPDSASYPFVVIAARRSSEREGSRGSAESNFGDGCKQPAFGKPLTIDGKPSP